MLDFNALLDFSHTHCVSICAVLVPMNLIATLLTLILVGQRRSRMQVWQSAGFAIAMAALMVLHVMTWLMVGVVMIPTFVLLSLGLCCFSINSWAVLHPQSLEHLLNGLVQISRQLFQRMIQRIEAS